MTGVAWVDMLLVWVGALTVVSGTTLGIVRWLRPLVHGVSQFLDDWNGEPERPGITPARPGVMVRLRQYDARLAAIEHELHPNAGKSLRDAVDRVEAQTTQASPPAVNVTVNPATPSTTGA